jgi:ribosomal protein S18 acetylase RimI-like enzyme
MILASTLALRCATSEETDFWFQLYASTRAEELQAWGWDAEQQTAFLKLQFTAQQHSYQSRYPQREHWIIALKDVAIGGIQLNRLPEKIHLIDFAILPAYRRQGFGTQVLQHLCETAQSVQLQVLQGSPAQALYTRLGFRPIADTDNLYLQMIWQANAIAKL